MKFNKIKRILPGLMRFNKNFYTSCKQSPPRMDIFQLSKILSSHFKVGKFEDAQKLFDEIPEKNVVFWSIMIYGYAKNGFYLKSLESFWQMRVSGLFPNSFTIVGVLVAIMGLRHLVLGETVHGLTVKYGICSDSFVCTAMIDTYAKCGRMQVAYKLFEGLKNPGLISCNVIISGFQFNQLFEKAFVMFNRFRVSSFVPNDSTMLILIRICVALGSPRLCQSIHCLILKFGLVSNIVVTNSILDMYSNLIDLKCATKLFNEMKVKDVISYTTMIGLLVDSEYATDALNLFIKMRDNGVNHDAVVIMNLISACAVLGDLNKGKQTHAQVIVCGLGFELPLVNSIIALYPKCGNLVSSRALFDQIIEKSLISWTVMIAGYVQNGDSREALKLMIKYRKKGNAFFDSIMLISVLTACGELALFEVCQQLHCLTFIFGFDMDRSVLNSFISTYSKCGKIEQAHDVFKSMGDLKDIVSWNAIINGFGINGQGETSLALFRDMNKHDEDYDSATYMCVLSACGHSGLVNDGLMIFNEMTKNVEIKPTEEHYGCVIDLLARAGCLSDINAFVSKTMDLNAWKALLNGCLIYGNMGLAEFAAKKVSELDPQDSSQMVLLSNAYASVERFKDAEELRLNMKKKSLVKNPGISILNGNPYDFS